MTEENCPKKMRDCNKNLLNIYLNTSYIVNNLIVDFII